MISIFVLEAGTKGRLASYQLQSDLQRMGMEGRAGQVYLNAAVLVDDLMLKDALDFVSDFNLRGLVWAERTNASTMHLYGFTREPRNLATSMGTLESVDWASSIVLDGQRWARVHHVNDWQDSSARLALNLYDYLMHGIGGDCGPQEARQAARSY